MSFPPSSLLLTPLPVNKGVESIIIQLRHLRIHSHVTCYEAVIVKSSAATLQPFLIKGEGRSGIMKSLNAHKLRYSIQ